MMEVENKKRFIIKRLNGKDDHAAIDEDEIIYIGIRTALGEKDKPVEYYLETDLEDIVVMTKSDYDQLRAELLEKAESKKESKDDK